MKDLVKGSISQYFYRPGIFCLEQPIIVISIPQQASGIS